MHASAILVEWNVGCCCCCFSSCCFSIVHHTCHNWLFLFQTIFKKSIFIFTGSKNLTSITFTHQAYQNYKIQWLICFYLLKMSNWSGSHQNIAPSCSVLPTFQPSSYIFVPEFSANPPVTGNEGVCTTGQPLLVSDAAGGTSVAFCGRGLNRLDCPSGFACNISPVDVYAVCCQTNGEQRRHTYSTVWKEEALGDLPWKRRR